MRIRFFSPENEAETGETLRRIASIDEFWVEFAHTARRLDGKADTAAWMAHLRAALAAVEPGLGLEITQEPDGTRTAYLLAVGGLHLLPLAQLVCDRAPQVVPWVIETARPPSALDAALEIVARDWGKNLATASARVGVGRGHAVEIVVASEHFESSEDPAGLDAANCLVSRLLGDSVFDTWVQNVSITVQPRPSLLRVVGGQTSRLPLDITQLAPSVAAAVQGVTDGLPEEPCHVNCERADWVMFELPATDAESDGDGSLQGDLVLATTMCPEMLKCFLSEGLFASERFSRCGEMFCYLELDFGEALAEEKVERRLQLEELLDRALVPGRLGCVVGSGLGTKFVYIHLALTQVAAAIELVCRRIGAQRLPGSARLLFCDEQLRDEWVAVPSI